MENVVSLAERRENYREFTDELIEDIALLENVFRIRFVPGKNIREIFPKGLKMKIRKDGRDCFPNTLLRTAEQIRMIGQVDMRTTWQGHAPAKPFAVSLFDRATGRQIARRVFA